jgi:tetratricopeptide (TPR) repeat protein
MGLQYLSKTSLVRSQNQAKSRIFLLLLTVIVCLSITGCTDKSGEYCNHGIALWKKKEYDDAISEFGKALEINPKNAKAYYFRANAFYDNGQYSRAWDDVHTAEDLGYRISPRFVKILREVSGRER